MCSFFAPRWTDAPSLDTLCQLTVDDVIWTIRISDVGLVDGLWPRLGRCGSWNPQDWPLPRVHSRDDENGRIKINDIDPVSMMYESFYAFGSIEDAAEIPRNSLCGHTIVSHHLQKLIALMEDGLTPKETRMLANTLHHWRDLAPKYQELAVVKEALRIQAEAHANRLAGIKPPPLQPAALSSARKPKTPIDGLAAAEFWTLVERSRQNSATCEEQVEELTGLLAALTAKKILAFSASLSERLNELYRWDIWAVAYIIMGGCSDDAFLYFRCWIICQGQEVFMHSIAEPTSLARKVSPDDEPECELLLSVAQAAYEQKTGNSLPDNGIAQPAEPAGNPWQEEDLKELYPELATRFGFGD